MSSVVVLVGFLGGGLLLGRPPLIFGSVVCSVVCVLERCSVLVGGVAVGSVVVGVVWAPGSVDWECGGGECGAGGCCGFRGSDICVFLAWWWCRW